MLNVVITDVVWNYGQNWYEMKSEDIVHNTTIAFDLTGDELEDKKLALAATTTISRKNFRFHELPFTIVLGRSFDLDKVISKAPGESWQAYTLRLHDPETTQYYVMILKLERNEELPHCIARGTRSVLTEVLSSWLKLFELLAKREYGIVVGEKARKSQRKLMFKLNLRIPEIDFINTHAEIVDMIQTSFEAAIQACAAAEEVFLGGASGVTSAQKQLLWALKISGRINIIFYENYAHSLLWTISRFLTLFAAHRKAQMMKLLALQVENDEIKRMIAKFGEFDEVVGIGRVICGNTTMDIKSFYFMFRVGQTYGDIRKRRKFQRFSEDVLEKEKIYIPGPKAFGKHDKDIVKANDWVVARVPDVFRPEPFSILPPKGYDASAEPFDPKGWFELAGDGGTERTAAERAAGSGSLGGSSKKRRRSRRSRVSRTRQRTKSKHYRR